MKRNAPMSLIEDTRSWRAALALVVGAASLGAQATPPEWGPSHGLVGMPVIVAPSPPSGLRYHLTHETVLLAEPPGLRHPDIEQAADARPPAKLGLEWKPAKAHLGFEQGAVGLYLHSGYQLALKANHGGLGLYLRGQF
jgi:hypothetical protein